MLFIWLLLFQSDTHLRFVEDSLAYEPLPEARGEYLQTPFSITFHENGDLYVLDSRTCRIHVWDKAGRYLRSFGKTGSGPGELTLPAKIDVSQHFLWVYDHAGQRLSQFDLKGVYKTTIQTDIRAYKFAALRDDLFLAAYKRHTDDEGTKASFRILNGRGQTKAILREISHRGYLQRLADRRQSIKAYGPELVIQQIAAKTWAFGFSQTQSIFEVNHKGEITRERRFNLEAGPPSDLDIQHHQEVRFNTIDGNSVAFKDWKHLEFSYAHDQAFYTHFTKTWDDKIIFALTPLGGFIRATGYHRASFVIHDWQTLKPHRRGFYQFPQGSFVYFEGGYVVVFEVNEAGDFRMKRIVLKGR